MQKEALIVVDMQNDFCPGGALGVIWDDSILPPVNRLIERHRHVILTQDWHTPDHTSFAANHAGKAPYDTVMMPYGKQILWPDHCVMGTEGAAFHRELNTTTAELVLRKGYHTDIDSYSAFFENNRTTPTGLAGYLQERGMKRLVFCGLTTDFCVAFSALDAVRCGFQASVVLGACQAVDMEGSLTMALKEMRKNGVELLLSA